MYTNNWTWGAGMMGSSPVFITLLPLIIVFALWSLFWKALGLWHSARRSQPWWFIAMLVLNTAGILELIYLFLVAKVKTQDLFKNDGMHHPHA